MSIDTLLKSGNSKSESRPIEDVERTFNTILISNDLLALLAEAEEDERRNIIDGAYKNLHSVIDIYNVYADNLSEDKQDDLRALIKEDAMALIAARSSAYTNIPGISDDEIYRQLQTEFSDHANLRDIDELIEAIKVLEYDPRLLEKVEHVVASLPAAQRDIARQTLARVAEDFTDDTQFLPIYKEEAARKTGRNIISFIERFGQSVTLDPEQIEDAYLKGQFKYASSKQENLVRRSSDGAQSKIGRLATNLSKRFRK